MTLIGVDDAIAQLESARAIIIKSEMVKAP